MVVLIVTLFSSVKVPPLGENVGVATVCITGAVGVADAASPSVVPFTARTLKL